MSWCCARWRPASLQMLLVALWLFGLPFVQVAEGCVGTPCAVAHLVTLQELVSAARISGVAVSRNGRYVSVRLERPDLAANTVALEWYILAIGDGRVVARANGGSPIWTPSGQFAAGDSQWSGDSGSLYFVKREKQAITVWKLSVDGHIVRVLSGPSDIDSFALDNANRRIFYVVGPSRRALEAAKLRELERGVILDGTQYIGAPLEDNFPYRSGMSSIRVRPGRWFPVGDNGHISVMVYDLRTKQSHAAGPTELQRYSALGVPKIVAANGRAVSWARSSSTGTIALIAHGDRESRQAMPSLVLGLARAGGGRLIWCTSRLCRHLTGQVRWRPGTAEFLFTTAHTPGIRTTTSWNADIYAWNEATLGVRRVFHYVGVLSADGNGVESNQCPATQLYAVCAVEGAAAPPELVRVDLANGLSKSLFDPNARLRKLLTATGLPRHLRYVVWRDDRGLSHSGILLTPLKSSAGSRRLPLVISSYRCVGFLRGGIGSTVPEFILWEAGFVVLCANEDDALDAPPYASPSAMPGQVTRMEYIYDGWKSAVRLLARQRLIDARRVGISGLSFTGETVNYVITHHPSFARAATAGHLDLTDPFDYFLLGGMGRVGEQIARIYGLKDPRTVRGVRYYRSASDALNAGKICAPLLVQTDEGEYQFGLEYYGALRLDRAPAEVIVFPDEAHIFWRPQELLLLEKRNIEWFRFWLQNYVAGKPWQHDRYSRWRALANEIPGECRGARERDK